MYTVKQLANLAHISTRTLHYYDEIGLLKPTTIGSNGYRYYDLEALLRLQQILLYRELGMPLENIRKILEEPDFEIQRALEEHKNALRERIAHLERLVETVEGTLMQLEGKKEMSSSELFAGFSEEQQAEYEKEAMEIYDPETVKASNRRWKSYSNEKKQQVLDEGKAVYQNFIRAMEKGPASPEAQACVEAWRTHMEYFWVPDEAQLLALANGYNQDPRFKANFDQMHPGLAEFVREAVKVYLEK